MSGEDDLAVWDASDAALMRESLRLANDAEANGEVPVGALVVRNGAIIGRGANAPLALNDPSAHAEIIAMRDAGRRLGNYRLSGCRLFVTLEPCMMCVGAIVHARIDEVVFAASDPKSGALGGVADLNGGPGLNHRFAVRHGLMADEAAQQLRAFFRARRVRSTE